MRPLWISSRGRADQGGPRTCDSLSRVLRCNPTGFDARLRSQWGDGWFDQCAVHFINIKSFVDCGACGYVGEGEHFPAFRAGSGSGGSAASRQCRSSTYPQAFLVNLPRRARAEALVLVLLIVEAEPGADAGLGLSDRRISVEVDFLVFEAAPQPLDKDVVHAAALAVHADHDAVPLQSAGEIVAGELAGLVGIEDLGAAVSSERFLERFLERLLERLDTEIGGARVGQSPRQHCAADPVHDDHQIEEAL